MNDSAMNAQMDWQAVEVDLRRLKQGVAAEIRAYPAPIPACDAHYNHLLEQRRLLSAELARLDAVRAARDASVADFLAASPCL